MTLNIPEKYVTERLEMKRWKVADYKSLFKAYANNPEKTKYVSWPTHNTEEDTKKYLQKAVKAWDEGKDYSYGIFEKQSGVLAGKIGFFNENGKVALGFIAAVGHEGKGYISEALKGMVNLLKDNKQVWRIYALCDDDNTPSQRVLQKTGFVKEAVLQGWHRFVNQNNTVKDCAFYNLPLNSSN